MVEELSHLECMQSQVITANLIAASHGVMNYVTNGTGIGQWAVTHTIGSWGTDTIICSVQNRTCYRYTVQIY